MCWICDRDVKAALALDYVRSLGPQPRLHFEAAAEFMKPLDGMLGTGHDLVPPQLTTVLLTTDTIPGDTSSTVTLTVGAPAIVSTLDTVGDQDFFRIELEAGKTYEIGQYLVTGGPSGVPLADAYLELYDAAGNLIVSADGGGPNTPSGLDALLTFTPEASGTYYVNARSYDQDSLNGTDGDFVGDYEIFAREASPFSYRPYYEPDDPLYALDWGSQVDGSSRNPDGAEGPRPTGNEFTGHAWNPYGIEGKNVIYYYFAKAGEVFVSEDPANPGLETIVAAGFRDWEMAAYELALDEYEKVADIVYIEVDNRNEADFIFITYDGTPDVGVLGRMSPPDEQNEGQTEFNRNGPGWNEQSLKPGGFSFQTLMHELGHGHGMSHPHDGGGRSGVLRGVFEEGPFDYSTGDYNLNQGIYTIMSYEDGWRPRSEAKSDVDGDGTLDAEGLRPDGHGAPPTSSSYGWVGSLSAFDIAVLQDKYGVNEEWATGDDTYVLKDQNADGTFYASIWDAGGTDEIVYDGARDATIDLRAATLRYEFGGGGRMSFALGIHGGFTIANAVVIENARTGSGDDTLTGNAAANRLDGGAGDDFFDAGGGGSDTVLGGGGGDAVYFGAAFDALDSAQGGAGEDQIALQGNYALVLGAATMTGFETLALLSGSDERFGDTAGNRYGYTLTLHDANVAAGAQLTVSFTGLGAGENVVFDGSAETDGSFIMFAGLGTDTLTGGSGGDGFFFGEGGRFGAADRVDGGAGIDQLGLRGNYAVVFAPDTIQGIETIALLSAKDVRWGAESDAYDYDLTLADGNVAAGARLVVTATGLAADESLTFDGSAESDGSFSLRGGAGADALTGGAQADQLFGGLGADALTGGGGDDVFLYLDAGQSAGASADSILDFGAGDKIDLGAIDAVAGGGDDAFTFVGAAAFSGTAGELRAVQSGDQWTVEADLDGDGLADLAIGVITSGGHALTAADFVL